MDKELYEELKHELKEGKLKLDRKNDLDMKLCLLLETDDLQPYELIRLKMYIHSGNNIVHGERLTLLSNQIQGKH